MKYPDNIFDDNYSRPWADVIAENKGTGRLSNEAIFEGAPEFFVEMPAPDDHEHVEIGYTLYTDTCVGEDRLPEAVADENGWLTDAAVEALIKRVAENLAEGDREKVSSSFDMGGDDANITITLAVPNNQEGTVEKVFERLINPFCAGATDPGGLDTLVK